MNPQSGCEGALLGCCLVLQELFSGFDAICKECVANVDIKTGEIGDGPARGHGDKSGSRQDTSVAYGDRTCIEELYC